MKLAIACAAATLLALPVRGSAEGPSPRSDQAANSEEVQLDELIERYAKRSGRKIVLDPRVRGGVETAGIDLGHLTHEQFLTILRVNYFAAVELDGLITVLPDAGLRQLPTPVYTDVDFKALDHEIVTLLLEVRSACASQLVPVLRPLMPQAAHMAAAPQSNMLILTDDAANVRRIAKIVERLDRAVPKDQKCVPDPPATPKPRD